MLAELVENGLVFSPPDFNVEIYGRKAPDGYRLAIVDQGVGMAEEELNRANARLRGEERFLVAPTRKLGLYVVGRLAQELSVNVSLAPSPVTGVTARLVLPTVLLDVARAGTPDKAAALSAGPARSAAAAVTAAAPVPPTAAVPSKTGDWLRQPVVEYVPWPAFDAATGKAASAMAAPPAGGVQRTANGLTKRVPRARGPVTPPPADSPTQDNRPAAVDRPPEDVRTMLSTFRAGVRRAVQDPASVPGEAADQSTTLPRTYANSQYGLHNGSIFRSSHDG
jgi:hypothetical protein